MRISCERCHTGASNFLLLYDRCDYVRIEDNTLFVHLIFKCKKCGQEHGVEFPLKNKK